MKGEPIVILLVEDDLAHIEIIKRNFEASRLANRLISVEDGQEALDYLFGTGVHAGQALPELPALIFPRDILLICGSAWVICILGGVIPAWRAGRLKPVEALRYE